MKRRRQHKLSDSTMDKAAFYGWVRANVPNGKHWSECNPPAYITELARKLGLAMSREEAGL